MTVYEYCIVSLDKKNLPGDFMVDYLDKLNELGEQGWELMHLQGKDGLFKREKVFDYKKSFGKALEEEV